MCNKRPGSAQAQNKVTFKTLSMLFMRGNGGKDEAGILPSAVDHVSYFSVQSFDQILDSRNVGFMAMRCENERDIDQKEQSSVDSW